MLANRLPDRSRTRASAGSHRHEKRAQEAARHAPEPKDCLPPCCPDRHRGHRRVLVERRVGIDFVAARRMAVTDDIHTTLARTEGLYPYYRAPGPVEREPPHTLWHPDRTAHHFPPVPA